MAIVFADGWEHGVAPTTAGSGFWTTVTTPSVFSVISSDVKNGTGALRVNAAAQTCLLDRTLSAGIRKLGIHLWFRRTDATNFCPVIEAYDASGRAAGLDLLGIDGGAETHPNELALNFWNGAAIVGTVYTVKTNVGQWCHVELLFDTTANPWVITARIDDVQYSSSTAIAAGDLTHFGIANTTASRTFDWCMDDLILYNAADADTPFPIGEHRILGHTLSADGTHNLDASPSSFFFKDDGTQTAIVNGDTSYQMLDELPPASTDRVEIHATPAIGQYLEYAFADSVINGNPRAVRIVTRVEKSAAGVNKVSAKIRESATDAAVFTDLNSTDSQSDYKTTIFNTKPSGGSWTQQAFSDLLFRYGFTDDATPEPWLSGVMAEVAFEVGEKIPDLSSRKPRFIYLRKNR